MSFPMTHLCVAYNLINFLKLSDTASFIVGSVAPDSVHFNDEYSDKLKARSHFFKYGPRWGETVDNDGWLNEICEFYKKHIKFDNRDFYIGYTVHLLTDYMNDVYVWQPFREKYVKVTFEGTFYKNCTEEQFKEKHDVFRKDLAVMNGWLYKYTESRDIIFKLLSEGKRISFENLYSEKDINRAVESLLYEQFELKEDYGENKCTCFTKSVLLDFIERCTIEIPSILSEL